MQSQNENNKNQARIVSPAQIALLDHVTHLDSGDISKSINRTIDLGLFFGDMPVDRDDLSHVYRVRELIPILEALAQEHRDMRGNG